MILQRSIVALLAPIQIIANQSIIESENYKAMLVISTSSILYERLTKIKMSKFTKSEREELKSMVRACSLLRLHDNEILTYIKNTSGLEPSQATITRIKAALKKDALKWYDGLVGKRHEFLALVKQNWDSINELKKLTLDNYSNAKQTNNAIERRKNIELALKIEEDIANYLDVLKFISEPSLPNLSNSTSDDKASIAPQLEDQEIPRF